MSIYYVTEQVVNTYEVNAFDEQDAITLVQTMCPSPIEIDTIEWSAELAGSEAEDTLETRCKRLEAKLDSILERLGGAGK